MKKYLLIFVLIFLLGCYTRKVAVRDHVVLEGIDVERVAVLPLEISPDFIPRNLEDCKELKVQWDRNFPRIFYEEFQPREGIVFLFPGVDYDTYPLNGLSPEEIMDKLQVDGLLKYKVYNYKDYGKTVSIGLLGLEIALNTLSVAAAIMIGSEQEPVMTDNWGKDYIVISMETYYRDSFVWESLPRYFNVSRFRMEKNQVERFMKETLVWSKNYLPFSETSPVIIVMEYDINIDLVRSVVASEVFRGGNEYFVEAYRIRESLEGKTEVKFLFSQEDAEKKQQKIDKFVEEIERKLECVHEMKISKIYKSDRKKVYDMALEAVKKKKPFHTWKLVEEEEENFLDIEVPIGGLFNGVFKDPTPADDRGVIRARFQEDSEGTCVYFLVHKSIPFTGKSHIKSFFKFLDKYLQESPVLSMEIRNLKGERAFE